MAETETTRSQAQRHPVLDAVVLDGTAIVVYYSGEIVTDFKLRTVNGPAVLLCEETVESSEDSFNTESLQYPVAVMLIGNASRRSML